MSASSQFPTPTQGPFRVTDGQVLAIVQVSDVSAGSSWAPGPAILNLDSLLGLVGVSSIQLKFTELSGNVQVDDIYVDPWASRN